MTMVTQARYIPVTRARVTSVYLLIVTFVTLGGETMMTLLATTIEAIHEGNVARAGVETRCTFFQVHNGKANLTPPAAEAEWRKIVSVDLGNDDSFAVATAGQWPTAFDGLKTSLRRAAQIAITVGRWRKKSQSKKWEGHYDSAFLGPYAASKAHWLKIFALLKTWITTGTFAVVDGTDARHERRSIIEVGTPASEYRNPTHGGSVHTP